MMVKVKICGLTNLSDAISAVECGADALGFNFYPASPRCVPVSKTRSILAELPGDICKVGVFVNETRQTVQSIVGRCRTGDVRGLTAVQFHGDEDPDFCRHWPLKVIKAFRVKSPDILQAINEFPADFFLLDSWSTGFGGSGTSFSWEWLAGRIPARTILAGGLDVANVGRAVCDLKPFAIDVCSGVEAAPGIKDHAKMHDFIAAAKGL